MTGNPVEGGDTDRASVAENAHSAEATVTPISGKRIAFIVFNYPLGISTMLVNSIALLARTNRLDVLISKHDRKTLPLDAWMDRHLVAFPNFSRSIPVRAIKFILQKLPRWLRPPANMLWWEAGNLDLLLFSRWLRKRIRQEAYDILIPVECFSLIAVDRSSPGRADIIYYNLELLDWGTDSPLYINQTVLKKLEHRALSKVSHVMITSPERGKIFASLNRFPLDRISALPVSPLRRTQGKRTRFFREKYALPDDRLLVIYSGNFEPWAQCLEIIASMDNWPANAVLVMHTWNRAALSKPYFAKMSRAATGRAVYFSDGYLRHEELALALSSADIGLMFYEAIDANFTEILFSSNKMAAYMAAGLPVICSPFPSLKKFVEDDERIGLGVDFAEIGAAISWISANMESYRANVAICRQRHFDFERHFSKAFSAYAGAGA